MLELQTIRRRFGELFRIVLLKPRHAGNSWAALSISGVRAPTSA
jgi:hypothetical protein